MKSLFFVVHLFTLLFFYHSALGKTPVQKEQVLGNCQFIPFEGIRTVEAITHPLGIYLHKVFVRNESNVTKAYCLTNANMDNGLNGISFGLKQWDIARSDENWQLFLAVLKAGDASPDMADALQIAAFENQLRGCIGPAQKFPIQDVCARKQRPVLDWSSASLQNAWQRSSALFATPAARKALDQTYAKALHKQLRQFDAHVTQFSPAMGLHALLKPGSQAELATLLILDYENYFGAGCFYAAMKASPLAYCSSIARLAPAGYDVTEGDIIRYVLNTKQGRNPESTGERDIFRRIENVLQVWGKFSPDFSAQHYTRDRTYFAGEMAQRLASMKERSKTKGISIPDTRLLERLITNAKASLNPVKP